MSCGSGEILNDSVTWGLRPNVWQLTQAHRFSGVIEWDTETEGALPLLIVDGRTFTWDQIGRMLMTFEGFTLKAIVEDTIEVVGGPLADGRLESEPSHEPAAAVPAAMVRRGASNRKAAERRTLFRSWPPGPHRLDALIEEATVDAYAESEQATAFLTVLREHLALPFGATVLDEAVVVETIDLSGADELIAICRRRGKRQKVRLLDLELPVPRPKGAELGRGVPPLVSTAIGALGSRHQPTIMAEPTKRKKWSDVRARLEAFDRQGLVSLLEELYDASVANRRFLHSRLTPRQSRHRRVPAAGRRRDIPRPVQQAPGQRPRRSRSHRRVPALNGRYSRDRRPHADVRGGGNGASRGSGLRR